MHPVLERAYAADWYTPWDPPNAIKSDSLYKRAVRDGWAEWIENELDWAAAQDGYVYDLSRTVDGDPAYWLDGHWLVGSDIIEPGTQEEIDTIKYVGRGDHFCRFAESFLYFTKAPNEGKPYRFLDWQRKVCTTLFGWVYINGDMRRRRYRDAYIAIPKKNGKALALDTPIYTVGRGWVTIGELKVGETLWGDIDGYVCTVTHLHPIFVPEYSYEVSFANGEKIVCNDEHRWTVCDSCGENEVTLDTTDVIVGKHFVRRTAVGQRPIAVSQIRRIAATAMRCITVSSPSGTFLVGETMVPTHNSDMASVIATYMVRADYTQKSYCYGCACDRAQAGIVYDEAASYVKSSPILSTEMVSIDSRKKIHHYESGSYFEVLSSEAHRNDGKDAHGVIFDELHRQPNRRLWDVMKKAGLARQQPIRVSITTYGPSTTDGSIWAEVHNGAKDQLDGRRDSYRSYVFIASAEPIPIVITEEAPKGATRLTVQSLQHPVDVGEVIELTPADVGNEVAEKIVIKTTEAARRFQRHLCIEPVDSLVPAFSEGEANKEWRNDHAIIRANPSVGVVFDPQTLRDEVRDSKSPEAEAQTMQLNFNICAGSGKKFISAAAWSACNRIAVEPVSLKRKPVYGGLDISFSNDLLAFALAVPRWTDGVKFANTETPRIDLLNWIWVPEASIEERETAEEFPYRYWAKQPYLFEDKGFVRFTPGTAVDFSKVVEDIIEICDQFQVRAIGVDPNYSGFVCPPLISRGLQVHAHRQGGVAMAPPTKIFSMLVHKGLLGHGSNPILTRSVNNAILHKPDRAGNTYPSKVHSHARIDPLIASIMAISFAANPPIDVDNAYSGEDGTGMF